jgi:hypothetical protein
MMSMPVMAQREQRQDDQYKDDGAEMKAMRIKTVGRDAVRSSDIGAVKMRAQQRDDTPHRQGDQRDPERDVREKAEPAMMPAMTMGMRVPPMAPVPHAAASALALPFGIARRRLLDGEIVPDTDIIFGHANLLGR